MDSSTKEKVNDLFSLMDDFSYDIDTKSDINLLQEDIKALKKELQSLRDRVARLEEANERKKKDLKKMRGELGSLFDK
jgi:predicted  nucleic acid-binding Zn-ribbon protein